MLHRHNLNHRSYHGIVTYVRYRGSMLYLTLSAWLSDPLPAAVRCDMVLHIRRFARDMYENNASAVMCDMVLHRVFHARHLWTNMQHLTSTGSTEYIMATRTRGSTTRVPITFVYHVYVIWCLPVLIFPKMPGRTFLQSVNKLFICSDPISADPICPSPRAGGPTTRVPISDLTGVGLTHQWGSCFSLGPAEFCCCCCCGYHGL